MLPQESPGSSLDNIPGKLEIRAELIEQFIHLGFITDGIEVVRSQVQTAAA
jgi:hypothetical protein